MRRTLRGLRNSLRGRLLAGTVAWILIAVAAAGWALSDLFRQHLGRQLSAELTVHMNQLIAALSVNDNNATGISFELTDPRLQLPYSGLYWQIERLDTDGKANRVLQSRSLWDQTLALPTANPLPALGALTEIAGPDGSAMLALIRVVRPAEGDASYRLIIATDARALSAPLGQFRLMLAIFLGLLAGGLTLSAVMQVLVGLRPLARLRQQLSQVRDGSQNRIQGSFPSEVQPLVDEFNQVLQNNQDIVQRSRTQAGNLAHALKTPLAILANGAEQEHTPFGKLVTEQVHTARRHVDHHLARARAAAAVQTPGMRTSVKAVTQPLARVLGKLHREKNIQWHIDAIPAELFFKGEQHDLQEMLGNLMENACKWTNGNVSVHAGAAETPGFIQIGVEDDGPGLPSELREKAFERGTRLDERMPGSGLGLAIVRDLAHAYGGSAAAYAAPQGGLGIRLVLPGI